MCLFFSRVDKIVITQSFLIGSVGDVMIGSQVDPTLFSAFLTVQNNIVGEFKICVKAIDING